MAFSPHMMGGQAGHPGANMAGHMQMLSAPPALMPPGMPMQPHHGGMQLACRGNLSSFPQPGHDAMVLGSSSLTAGHPSPMMPFEMQQLQAARQQGRLPSIHSIGPSLQGYGQPDLGHTYGHAGMLLQTPMSPAINLSPAGRPPMQAQQAQAMQDLRAMQHQQAVAQSMGLAGGHSIPQTQNSAISHPDLHAIHGMPAPPQSPNAAAYVIGAQPMNVDGQLRGYGAGSASQHQAGNGDFEVEQEMTVKTKLKGRGTFSGNMSGSMQDSVGMSHGLGLGTASNRAQAYPQTYDPRISAQHEALGMLPASGGMPNFQQGW